MEKATRYGRLRRLIIGIVGVSALLLLVNVFGEVARSRPATGPSKSVGVPGYDYATRPLDEILEYRDIVSENTTYEFVRSNNDLVYSSLYHAEDEYSFQENWVLWLLDHVTPSNLIRSQNTDRIIEGGRGVCGQVSQVLKTIVERSGASAHFLALTGHVVLEVKVNGSWVVADPNYGVTFPFGLKELEDPKNEPLIRETLSSRGFSKPRIDNYLRIVQSSDDNTVFPDGGALKPNRATAEPIAAWLIWVIPGALLIGSTFEWLRRGRSCASFPSAVKKRGRADRIVDPAPGTLYR